MTVAMLVRTLTVALALALGAAGQEQSTTQGVCLVYELPANALRKAAERAGATVDSVADEVLDRVRRRLGDLGTAERRGPNLFAVTADPGASVDVLRRGIELPGKLDICMVATDADMDAKGRRLFDLAKERQRLTDWLDHGGRELMFQDPTAIDRFLNDPNVGPVAGKDLAWFAHVVEPFGQKQQIWRDLFARRTETPELTAATVLVNDPADCAGPTVPPQVLARPPAQRRVIELVAVNMRQVHFDQTSLEPKTTAASLGFDRQHCIRYVIRPPLSNDFAEWTELHRGHHLVFVLDRRVCCAPLLERRIVASGTFGSFSRTEAEAAALALRTGPLPVTPVFVRQEPPHR